MAGAHVATTGCPAQECKKFMRSHTVSSDSAQFATACVVSLPGTAGGWIGWLVTSTCSGGGWLGSIAGEVVRLLALIVSSSASSGGVDWGGPFVIFRWYKPFL